MYIVAVAGEWVQIQTVLGNNTDKHRKSALVPFLKRSQRSFLPWPKINQQILVDGTIENDQTFAIHDSPFPSYFKSCQPMEQLVDLAGVALPTNKIIILAAINATRIVTDTEYYSANNHTECTVCDRLPSMGVIEQQILNFVKI